MLQIRHELEVARSRLTKLQSELHGRCCQRFHWIFRKANFMAGSAKDFIGFLFDFLLTFFRLSFDFL